MTKGQDFSLLSAIYDPVIKKLALQIRDISQAHRDVDQIREILEAKGSNFFDNLTRKSVERVCRNLQIHFYSKEEVVFFQGDESDGYYFILQGAVAIHAYPEATDTNNVSFIAALMDAKN